MNAEDRVYRRVPCNPVGYCTCGWCGCRSFVPPPPVREYRALPRLLLLEGRLEEANMYQDRWEHHGSYEELEEI